MDKNDKLSPMESAKLLFKRQISQLARAETRGEVFLWIFTKNKCCPSRCKMSLRSFDCFCCAMGLDGDAIAREIWRNASPGLRAKLAKIKNQLVGNGYTFSQV